MLGESWQILVLALTLFMRIEHDRDDGRVSQFESVR